MGILRRIFGREPKPAPRPPINEDWKAGDLAVSLTSVWHTHPLAEHPREGKVYRVIAVYPARSWVDHSPIWCLSLAGINQGPTEGYNATWFRKVTPDAVECEKQFASFVKEGGKVITPEIIKHVTMGEG